MSSPHLTYIILESIQGKKLTPKLVMILNIFVYVGLRHILPKYLFMDLSDFKKVF